MEDLWPNFDEKTSVKPPIAIIKEQASKLRDKTNDMVFADIDKNNKLSKIMQFDINGKFELYICPSFQYSFYLEAPTLEYRYKLLSIAHDIFLYPVYFFEVDKDIRIELNIDEKDAVTINNENELLVFLKNVFTANKTTKIVNALIIQQVS